MRQANIRRFTVIAAAAGLLGLSGLGVPAASAQTGPPTLSGEELSASTLVTGAVNCNSSGPFSFTALGTATGPYAGTFSETVSGDALSGQTISGDYTASFTITSATGDVTGTETLTSTISGGDACYQDPTDFSIGGGSDYQATIQPSGGGTYTDQGTSYFNWSMDAAAGQPANGDDEFASSQSQTTPVVVPTVTTVASSTSGVSDYGQPVTFTATVSPSDGNGTVAFDADGVPIAGCTSLPLTLVDGSGQAACTPAPTQLAAGLDTITATYSGDPSYLTSTGTLPGGQDVNPAQLDVTVAGSQTYGEPATQAFTITGSSGFLPGDSLAKLTGTLSCTTTVTATDPDGVYTGTISCGGLSDPDYDISYTDGGFTVTTAAASLTYTGTTGLTTPASLVPAASVSNGPAACESDQPVAFTLNANPVTGATGTYTLETATTNSSGTATGVAISTSGWQPGSYTITAAFDGSGSCAVPSATAPLAVAVAGTAAAGAGSYTVPGAGTVRMGFEVGKLPHSARYAGQLSVVQGKTWMFAASATSYTSTSATAGTLGGTGTLWWWNPALNRGRGGWQQAASGVTYTATFTATTAAAAASFGITIAYTPAVGQPSALPDSGPVALTQGGIWVAPLGAQALF
jgi:large repetitive protein